MVHQSVRSIQSSLPLIPFAAISTTFAAGLYNSTKVHATYLNDPLSLGGERSGYSPLNPLYSIKSSMETMQSNVSTIANAIEKALEFFKDFDQHIITFSVDLLGWVYYLMSTVVLQTPTWLFTNTWFRDTSLVFSGISIALVTLFTMIESIKQMIQKKGIKHVPFEKIMKRFPISLLVAGIAPKALEIGFGFLNKISHAITQIGFHEIKEGRPFSHTLFYELDAVILLGFDVLLIAMLFPIILYNGRRYFDLYCLGAITPLAMSAWMFDNYKRYHRMWWNKIKELSMVQIIYAFFITMIGIFIFGTRNVVEPGSMILKLLIVAGGMWRMTNPPSFITNRVDKGKDATGVYSDLKKTFKLTGIRENGIDPGKIAVKKLLDHWKKGK